jgi:hypothetical protein
MEQVQLTTPTENTTEQKPPTTEVENIPRADERIRNLISEKKALEDKLNALQTAQAEATRLAEEKKAKDAGNYETLIAQVKTEREQEKQKLNTLISNTYLESLASKHSIAKPEYLKLFTEQVEIDNMEIKNADKVASAFEKFKMDNPNLFSAPNANVPKTDNQPVKSVKTTQTVAETSGYDLMRAGVDEFLKKK